MKMLFVLIILAVILLAAAIAVFFWAVRSSQFDDLDVHAYDILKDDQYEDSVPKNNKQTSKESLGKPE